MSINFDNYSQKANEFVKEIAAELGSPEDTGHAGRVIRSVFHTVRETITPEESMHMIAQLPLYIKAVYVDNWKLSEKQGKVRSMEEFLGELRQKAWKDRI